MSAGDSKVENEALEGHEDRFVSYRYGLQEYINSYSMSSVPNHGEPLSELEEDHSFRQSMASYLVMNNLCARDSKRVEKSFYEIDATCGRIIYDCWLGGEDTSAMRLVDLYSGTGCLSYHMEEFFEEIVKFEYSRTKISGDKSRQRSEFIFGKIFWIKTNLTH